VAVEEAPKRQERGLRRIEQILDAAEDVFAAEGYEATTTNLIAARAGISPGSLYQYFSNKRAIADALGERYIQRIAASGAAAYDEAYATLPLADVIDRVIDPMVAFNLAHPGAKALLSGAHLSPELADATAVMHDALCGFVEQLVAARAPHMPERDRVLVADVSVQIYAGLLPSVLAAPPRERARRIRELKSAFVGYWSSFDERGA
jgi:AcrR family transcriptional regulator